MQRALQASPVGKLPSGKILYACLLAGVIFCFLPFRAALDVIDILEGVAEKFFLVGAVRAPPRSVHFCPALGYTLGESIQCAHWLAIVSKIVSCPCDDHDRQGHSEPS